MYKLVALITALMFALGAQVAFAADARKDAAPAPKVEKADKGEPKLDKPASVTEEAWKKMSDVDKKKAVEKAAKEKAAADKSASKGTMAAAPKKEKKGGC